MKKIIERTSSMSEMNSIVSACPCMQLSQIDYAQAKLKKRTIFDSIRERLWTPKPVEEAPICESKKDKIVQYYYIIPEEIERKESELANLKWHDLKRKRELTSEIRALKVKRTNYYNSILEYCSPTGEYSDELQKEWQEFYLSHEEDMLQWIDYNKSKFKPDMLDIDRQELLESYCEEYFYSLETFYSNVQGLKQDVKRNAKLLQTVFGKDYRNAKFSDILLELRKAIYGNAINYREYDLPTTSENKFFKSSSKAENIEADMLQLEEDYEEMRGIENREEYINRAISIFQKFVQIHPYVDGNGRTSRALLDVMLLNKDIVPPVLYDTYYQRGNLDRLSDEYLFNSNKKPLQDYIIAQINKVQPDSYYQNQASKELTPEEPQESR